MSTRKLDLLNLHVTNTGRVVLSDADLELLGEHYSSHGMAGGDNSPNNTNCTNTTSCQGSTNTGCRNHFGKCGGSTNSHSCTNTSIDP